MQDAVAPEAAAKAVKKTSSKAAVRGVAVSGRAWKQVESKRFSAIGRTTALAKGTPFKVQQAERMARKRAQAESQRIRDERKQKLEEMRTKREEKKKRRAENLLKSTTYQVISDPNKMKRMSKKQLRMIKKTRVNEQGVVEFVGAYEK